MQFSFPTPISTTSVALTLPLSNSLNALDKPLELVVAVIDEDVGTLSYHDPAHSPDCLGDEPVPIYLPVLLLLTANVANVCYWGSSTPLSELPIFSSPAKQDDIFMTNQPDWTIDQLMELQYNMWQHTV